VSDIVNPGMFRRERLKAIDAEHTPRIKELEKALASASGEEADSLRLELGRAQLVHGTARLAVEADPETPSGPTVAY